MSAKMYSKNCECFIIQVKKGALISAIKCNKSVWWPGSTHIR